MKHSNTVKKASTQSKKTGKKSVPTSKAKQLFVNYLGNRLAVLSSAAFLLLVGGFVASQALTKDDSSQNIRNVNQLSASKQTEAGQDNASGTAATTATTDSTTGSQTTGAASKTTSKTTSKSAATGNKSANASVGSVATPASKVANFTLSTTTISVVSDNYSTADNVTTFAFSANSAGDYPIAMTISGAPANTGLDGGGDNMYTARALSYRFTPGKAVPGTYTLTLTVRNPVDASYAPVTKLMTLNVLPPFNYSCKTPPSLVTLETINGSQYANVTIKITRINGHNRLINFDVYAIDTSNSANTGHQAVTASGDQSTVTVKVPYRGTGRPTIETHSGDMIGNHPGCYNLE